MPAQHVPDSLDIPKCDDDQDLGKATYETGLTAVGIVAVLVANVAYVGFLTTPGGPDPYWSDCHYSIYAGYIYLNGYSLVFAVAALMAVTVGPFFLISQRKKDPLTDERIEAIVLVGFMHMILSLIALLGAFTCAGLVTALVNPPPLSCSLITCHDGGVPCSTVPAETSKIGTTWSLDPQLVALNRATFWPGGNASKADVPVVMCANYATISGRPVSQSLMGAPKVFSALGAPTQYFNPCRGDGLVQPGDQKAHTSTPYLPPNASCLFLNPDVFNEGYVSLGDHGPATWCSVSSAGGQDSPLGASLELNGYQVHNVMKLLSYQMEGLNEKYSNDSLQNIYSAFDKVFQAWFSAQFTNVSDVTVEQTASDNGGCFSEMEWQDMPGVSQLLRPAFYGRGSTGLNGSQAILHKDGEFDPAIDFVHRASHSPWKYKWKDLYQTSQMRLYVELLGGMMDLNLHSHTVIPDCVIEVLQLGASAEVKCSHLGSTLPRLPASTSYVQATEPESLEAMSARLATTSQWHTLDDSLSRALPSSEDSFQTHKVYADLLYWVKEFRGKMTDFTRGPLAGVATNYATLRYICSVGDRNVLCDKGDLFSPIEPPLAVDPNGQYLSRADIIKYSGQDISVSEATSELESGITVMLAGGILANLVTVLWVAIRPEVKRVCKARRLQRLRQPVESIQLLNTWHVGSLGFCNDQRPRSAGFVSLRDLPSQDHIELADMYMDCSEELRLE